MISLSEFSHSLEMEEKWHGSHSENDRRVSLRAGALSMIYENGNLRYIDGRNQGVRTVLGKGDRLGTDTATGFQNKASRRIIRVCVQQLHQS